MASSSVSPSFCLGQRGLGYFILTCLLSCLSIFNEDCWFFEINLISRVFGEDNSGLALGKILKYVELGIGDAVSHYLLTPVLLSHLNNPISVPFYKYKMNKSNSNLTLSLHRITLLLCILSGILLFIMNFHTNIRLGLGLGEPLKHVFFF